MKKKIIITSLILFLVPTILFAVLYGVMRYAIYNTGDDYSQQIIGNWEGVQFLSNKQLQPCDESNAISLLFDENTVEIGGTLVKTGKYEYKWDTGSIAKVNIDGEKTIFVFSINSIGQLKVTINAMDYIITFNKVGA